ncbi:alpha/beta hydrolase family protein [Rhodanobacter ginsengiterrae]|uniref:alpha/beta hydrolase family protein n=1 Tax=Rhodanobacter ginsengiterrae TaxID=2008451 RepID=UPI003CF5AFEC
MLNLSRYIPFPAWLRTLSLDLGDDATMARLHAQSPLANAASMQRPLLLIAGGEDHRVAIRGVIAYAAQLQLLGRDVSLLVDAEAGHSNEDPLAKEAMFYLIERLLQRHLAGASAAPPDAALREYLQRNLRLTGKDLRGE